MGVPICVGLIVVGIFVIDIEIKKAYIRTLKQLDVSQ